VDYDFFSAESPNAKARFELGDGPLLLQVGALIQRKNHILSIRALKTLKQHLGSIKLAIVGEGPWKPILEEEARKLGLEKDVIFMGSISENELRILYHACDVNLFPVKDQTWGLVPFEALAAGKPSIVAEGCGATEVIGREKIGFLIKPSVEELAGAVLLALKHPELGEDMVKRGKQYVRENLTWEKYARDVYNVFRHVLSSGRR
jgi:glycosyltransferase involved in cell wall biosynthesis